MTSKQRAKRRASRKPDRELSHELIEEVCAALADNRRVRRALPEHGRLHIDRQLPFLCVYRRPTDHTDAGTSRLVQGEASYLIATAKPSYRRQLSHLVQRIVETLSAEFGAFLIVEIWAAPDGGRANDPAVPSVRPTFSIKASPAAAMTPVVDVLARRLERIKVLKQRVNVDVVREGKTHPPSMQPLLSRAQARGLNCWSIGIVVPPVYRKLDTAAEFPLLARALRNGLSLALRKTYFEFARGCTTESPPHYHSLGRNAVVKAVWSVDRQLAEVSNQFDYLLSLTPVNTTAAWKRFRRSQCEVEPEFHYRPLPVDPSVLKRRLYDIPIERVEDPALQRLFREKQEELELKLTMLRDRDTPRFLYESLQLFGGADAGLLKLAKKLFRELPVKPLRERGPSLQAEDFARRVRAEFEYYRRASADFAADVEVTPEVSGLLVSNGKLLINSELVLPQSRVSALLAHEVGTHLLTYCNGRVQPFQQLYSGLAGYEELQEGLAVLSEHLVGGLTPSRLRQLAGRVVAVSHRVQGASFVDTFRSLTRDYRFTQRTAYNITMRVHRAGGLTKDAVYLRGLQGILHYVKRGGDLRALLVGKIGIEHIGIIQELQYRKVLAPASLVPRYLSDTTSLDRLQRLREAGASITALARDISQRTEEPNKRPDSASRRN